jgi:hypothetical protein
MRFLVMPFVFLFWPLVLNAQVVVTKFDLNTRMGESFLFFSIDSDLPDETEVNITIRRLYFKKGMPEAYAIEYFSEKRALENWRTEQTIKIDNREWLRKLKEHQKTVSKFGMGFDVASVSENVSIRAVVPINQSDPRFGKRNSKLTGAIVKYSGNYNIVDSDVEISYPLDSRTASEVTSIQPSLDPLKLGIGHSYILSKETPLMPSPDISTQGDSLENLMDALKKAKKIPSKGIITIKSRRVVNDTPWYFVSAQAGSSVFQGWINSGALVGQDLSVVN